MELNLSLLIDTPIQTPPVDWVKYPSNKIHKYRIVYEIIENALILRTTRIIMDFNEETIETISQTSIVEFQSPTVKDYLVNNLEPFLTKISQKLISNLEDYVDILAEFKKLPEDSKPHKDSGTIHKWDSYKKEITFHDSPPRYSLDFNMNDDLEPSNFKPKSLIRTGTSDEKFATYFGLPISKNPIC